MRAEQTSFLFGANAPFIEELYARYLGDPNAVDSEWRTFFEALAEQQGDVLAEVRGASWAPNGARVIGAVDPETLPSAGQPQRQGQRQGQRRRRPGADRRPDRGSDPRRRARHLARASADPLLSRARPSRGRPRSARPDQAPSCIASSIPRPTASPTPTWTGRSSSTTSLGLRVRDPAPDLGPPAQDLLRHDRRRVHAHPGSRPEGVDPGAHRGRREPHRVHRRRPPHHPASASPRPRASSAFSARSTSAPSASASTAAKSLIPGIEQILKRGGQLGVPRGRHRHAASRPAQHAGQHREQAATRRCSPSSGARSSQPEDVQGSGDVKYHLGTSADREFDGTRVHLSLAPNPSHLEAVNPWCSARCAPSRTSAATPSAARSWRS